VTSFQPNACHGQKSLIQWRYYVRKGNMTFRCSDMGRWYEVNKKPLKDKLLFQGLNRGYLISLSPHSPPPFLLNLCSKNRKWSWNEWL